MGMRLSTSSTSTSTGTRTGGSGTGTGTRTGGSGTSTGTGTDTRTGGRGTSTGTRTGGSGTSTGTGTGTRTGGRGTSTGTKTGGSGTSTGTGTGTRTGGRGTSTGTRTGGSGTSTGTGTGTDTRTGGRGTSTGTRTGGSGTSTGTRTGGSSTSIGTRTGGSSTSTSTGTRTGGSGKSTPIVREFVKVEGGGNAKGQGDAIRFRLVSYNILAQVYVKNHDHFTHSPSPCLRWEARSQQILTLLKNLGADFYSLQEVDEYDSFYKKSMEGLGYSSIYVQRSGQKRDGCGIFYKKDRAQLLLEEKIEYNDLVSSEHDKASSSSDKRKAPQTNRNNRDAPNQVKSTPQHRGESDFKKDCVGIMAAFKLKHPFHHVLVLANTHLHWDPELAYVKLAQAKYLLARLAKLKEHVAKRFHCTPSVMLCGDFNSTPGDKVYQYLVSGNTLSTSSERCSEPEGLPLPLCSVYASGRRREPRFTTCTPKFKSTIDYVFFSPSHCLKPVSILQLPELDSADVAGGLPNHSHPSDHMPIGAEFEITKH